MTLAIFDLDNTLIAGDSDHAWGAFLCELGIVDVAYHARENDRFYQQYKEGGLDVHAYLRFALGPIKGKSVAEVAELQRQFIDEKISPILLPKANELLQKHRDQGDRLLIITATNTVVTRPIATMLGVHEMIGSEAEIVNGHYTGEPFGLPSFQQGKVTRLEEWLHAEGESLEGAWFYSDSFNDLPLLEYVDKPVAVDPDPTLEAAAQAQGWPIISLRN